MFIRIADTNWSSSVSVSKDFYLSIVSRFKFVTILFYDGKVLCRGQFLFIMQLNVFRILRKKAKSYQKNWRNFFETGEMKLMKDQSNGNTSFEICKLRVRSNTENDFIKSKPSIHLWCRTFFGAKPQSFKNPRDMSLVKTINDKLFVKIPNDYQYAI